MTRVRNFIINVLFAQILVKNKKYITVAYNTQYLRFVPLRLSKIYIYFNGMPIIK